MVCASKQDALVAIAVRLLQTAELYAFAIMPAVEAASVDDVNVDGGDDDGEQQQRQDIGSGHGGRLPSIPIERLNDVAVLEEFARR